MIQLLKTEDALKCLLFNAPTSPNMVTVRDVRTNGNHTGTPRTSLFKEALFSRKRHRCTFVWWDRFHLRALGTIRVRSGVRAWEIERLHLNEEGQRVTEELLERLSQYAGQRGAERIFLRVPHDSSLVEHARRAGFFPSHKEYLLHGEVGRTISGDAGKETPGCLRPRQAHEEFALFQLYCASTPVQVRAALGITLDQWRDARERAFGNATELAYLRDNKITGWLNFHPQRRATPVDLVVHPNDEEALSALVSHALSQRQLQTWLLPEYQDMTRRLLVHSGFEEVGCYYQLVKCLAVKVARPATARMEVYV